MVMRARNVITDSVMAEIAQEYPAGTSEFENSVRYHIVSFAQRIKVSILVLDYLMEVYNSSKKN